MVSFLLKFILYVQFFVTNLKKKYIKELKHSSSICSTNLHKFSHKRIKILENQLFLNCLDQIV